MLISYLHNFIFIKTQKTGGTTVEAVFASFCGPDDVVTPLGRSDEMERSNGKPICRNFEVTPRREKKYIDAMIVDGPRYRRRRRKDMKFYAHMPAAEIKSAVDPSFWNTAFKFTTERHPYEKAVSKAFFLLGPDGSMDSFPEILDRVVMREAYAGFRFYAIDNQVVVDEIAKIESLDANLRGVAQRLGLQLPGRLPAMKKVSRKDPRPAREILSQEQKDHIYRVCKREFDLLGYEP